MIRKRFSFRLGRCRYILCAIFITILLHQLMKYGDFHDIFKSKECEKLLQSEFSEKAKKYVYFGNEKKAKVLNVTELRQWILKQNVNEKVLNIDSYGPLTTNTLTFVVHVHQYSCNMHYLLASLSEVKGIQDALVIFSHSYVDHNLNRLLRSIEFCRVLQIFYPYSLQAYPNEFPGYDKNDCLSNSNTKAAEKFNCNSAMTPDVLGRYRDPIYAEKKHYWWWTANKVFRGLTHITGSEGLVVFLEHNFYIYRNFIYIAYQMKSIADTLPQCDFLSLGSTLDLKGENVYGLEFTTWHPKYHSNILALDIFSWNNIELYYDIFCRTDDYSWSRSLFEVSINRRNGRMFKVLSSSAARELKACPSIGFLMNCHVEKDIIEIINLQKNEQVLFPPYFEVHHDIELYDDEVISVDYAELSGGWNDQRDKDMCKNVTVNKFKKYIVTPNKNDNLETYS